MGTPAAVNSRHRPVTLSVSPLSTQKFVGLHVRREVQGSVTEKRTIVIGK
jgi:hypothetical protein